jgi:hypothetical protein
MAQFQPESLSVYLSAEYPPKEAIRYRQVHGGETDYGRFFVQAGNALPNRWPATGVRGDNGSSAPRGQANYLFLANRPRAAFSAITANLVDRCYSPGPHAF